MDQLAATYIKRGGSPSLQPQNVGNQDVANDDDGDDIPEYKYDPDGIDLIDSAIKPLIPISEGIKAHKEKNYEKAWKCFEKQAENGNRKGKHWKAHYLWEGLFVPKDKISAIKLYKEAADDGVADAQLRYAFGLPDKDLKTLNLNPKDSVKYLQLAAESGNDVAQFHIGEAYFKGKLGFKQDQEVATIWFKRSALQKNKNAKKKLQELEVDIEDM